MKVDDPEFVKDMSEAGREITRCFIRAHMALDFAVTALKELTDLRDHMTKMNQGPEAALVTAAIELLQAATKPANPEYRMEIRMQTLEEQFYERAAAELSEQRTSPGLMAKAFSEADGDERKAGARYLKLRVAQMDAEHQAAEASRNAEAQRRVAAEQEEQQRAVMQSLGITHNGEYFECGEMHFDRLADAVNFANESKR